MKKFILYLLLPFLLVSCDYILKQKSDGITLKDTLPELGIAVLKDTNGCIKEPGFKWSKIKKECIRVVNEGYRINPINDLDNLESSKSGYVLLSEDALAAEVFLQELPQSIYLTRKYKDQIFKEKKYSLSIPDGYSLYCNDSLIYKAAKTAVKPIVTSDIENQ